MSIKYTEEYVSNFVAIKKNIIVNYEFRKNKRRYFNCTCMIDGYTWDVFMHTLLNTTSRCPCCSNSVLNDKNRFSSQHPELIKYFQDARDSDLYSVGSEALINVKCIECGNKQTTTPYNLIRYSGISCKACSDGISVPQKFIYNVLKQIGINFEIEKTFKWSQKKRYDFYIPSLNMIIEAHGVQHYEDTSRMILLNEVQENDALKENLAKENGIEHYIVIDCRKSDYLYLKENTQNCLSPYFYLLNIDWDYIFNKCSCSLIVEACELFKTGLSSGKISKELKLSQQTIIKYLKQGNLSGIIYYNPQDEINKKNINSSKGVVQYDLSGNLIQSFKSMGMASSVTNTLKGSISNACIGRCKTANGFLWRFLDEQPTEQIL